MTRYNCYVCQLFKKAKFYPASQPYPTHKICDKCIAKNLRRNKTMIDTIIKKTKITPTLEEQINIELSFTTMKELTEVTKENPKTANLIRDMGECTDKDIIRLNLKKLDLSESSVDELVMHFYTVAIINERSKTQKPTSSKDKFKRGKNKVSRSNNTNNTDNMNKIDNTDKIDKLEHTSSLDHQDLQTCTEKDSIQDTSLADELLARAKKS